MSFLSGDITPPRRAATDSQVTSEALNKEWRYSQLFGGPKAFADEIMEIERTAGESLLFEVPFCTTPEELEATADSSLSLPSSDRGETPARPRRPFISHASGEENVRVFHSKDFGTNVTADDTRPTTRSQWVQTCREQKSKLLDELLRASNVREQPTCEPSKENEASERDSKEAFKRSKLWEDLVPALHHHYSRLYSQLVGYQEEQQPSSSLDLRTTHPIDIEMGSDGPFVIAFHLEAQLEAGSQRDAARKETGEPEVSSTIKTEFYGVKNGHDEGWKWEINDA